MKQLSDITEGNSIIVTGVGQHQMWAAQHYAYKEPNSLLTSGGLGAMGFEVPAALGAKVGRPDKTVWSIAGDGGFQMTSAIWPPRWKTTIDVKFAILNNGTLGMVHQWQDSSTTRTFCHGVFREPGFVKLAEAYGITGIRVTDKAQVDAAIRQAMETPGPGWLTSSSSRTNRCTRYPGGESVNEIMEEPIPERIF